MPPTSDAPGWRAAGVLRAALAAAAALAWAAAVGCGPGEEGRPANRASAASATGSGVRAGTAAAPWTERIAVDSGGGHVGRWRMNQSDWRYVDDPAVTLAGDGSTVVTWVDHARKAVLLQVYGPDGAPRFAEPTDVSRSPDVFSWLPRVRIGSGGSDGSAGSDDPAGSDVRRRIHVLWQEIVFSGGTHGGEAFYARSTDGGRSFGEPVNLSRTPAGDGKGRLTADRWFNGSLDLALAPGGRVYAAWTAYEGPLWLARSTDGGASFSAPVRVAGGDSVPARGPDLAVGPGDTVHLAWGVGDDPAADLRLATSADGGRTFGAPRRVRPGPDHADGPKVEVGADGALHLAWGSSPDGPFARSRILYARSDDGGASFGSASVVSEPHGERFRSADHPELAVVGADTVMVAWGLHPSGPRLSRGYGHAVSVDGGRGFRPPSVLDGTVPSAGGWTGSLQGGFRQRLAAAEGRAAFGWATFRPDEASRVWLVRGPLSGWTDPVPRP